MSTVAVVKEPDMAKALRKLFELLGGLEKFVKKGDRVWIKPNWNTNTVNEEAMLANGTDPRAVAELVRLCREITDDVVVAELIGAGGTSAGCYEFEFQGVTYGDYVRQAGGQLIEIDTSPYRRVKLSKGLIHHEIDLPEIVFQNDVYISMPKVKTHLVENMSLSTKNNMGLLKTEDKMRFHRSDVSNKIVDLLEVAKPDLVVIEGFTAGEGQCPHNGTLKKDVNLVIGSTDLVAADAVTARIFGYDPMTIPIVRIAARRGYGTLDADEIVVVGESIESVAARLKPAIRRWDGLYPIDCIMGAVCDGCPAWVQSALDGWVVYSEYDYFRQMKEKGIRPTYLCGRDLEITPEEVEERAKVGPVILFGDCASDWLKEHPKVTYVYGCPPWDSYNRLVEAYKEWSLRVTFF